MSARGRLQAGAVALAAAALGVTLTGCGSASEPSPPTGVDGLVVPTPDPDPEDFVARVDNPWFPVLPGARWTYSTADGAGTTTVVAQAGPAAADEVYYRDTLTWARETGNSDLVETLTRNGPPPYTDTRLYDLEGDEAPVEALDEEEHGQETIKTYKKS